MMKNTKFRRILLLLACAVLLVSLSVGATLAYLTSTADVENTFTVGNVKIKLDEVLLDDNGDIVKVNGEVQRTEDGNDDIHLLPGRKIPKDPTVTVLEGSENCYLRVKVTVDVSAGYKKPTDEGTNGTTPWEDEFEAWAKQFAYAYIRNGETPGFNSEDWTVVESEQGDCVINPNESTITYILTYKNGSTKNIVEKPESDKEFPVFTHVEVGRYQDNADLAKLAGMKINVVAEAIQADGFEDATAAWKAFEDQKAFEEEFKNQQNPGNQEGSENQN